MKRTIFLQDENALWLKGNIHSHSTFSDGSLTPEEMKDAYRHHGYDFLARRAHRATAMGSVHPTAGTTSLFIRDSMLSVVSLSSITYFRKLSSPLLRKSR